MARVGRVGEKARGCWDRRAPERRERGPLRGPGKAEGARKRPRAAREHPTEREEDGEPRESHQREECDLRQV